LWDETGQATFRRFCSDPNLDLAKRLRELTASAPLKLMQKAAALREQGRDVISLGAGEPDFETPEPARRAAHAAIDAGKTHYTPCPGEKALRVAIARKLATENGLEYSADEILVSTGAKQSLHNAFLALLDPGDVAVIPAPYWVTYPEAARLVGATPRIVPTEPGSGFKLDLVRLDAALRGARLFVFNSPSNPSGAVYSHTEIAALGELLLRHDCWIVTDEIYEKLVFDGAEHHSLPAVCPRLRERTVVVNGFSKAYAMTGWRLGYAAGPRDAIEAMDLVQSHTTSNASSISQHAAIGALGSDGADLRRMVAAFARRRQVVLDALAAIPGLTLVPPQGAFYVFPDASRYFEDGGGSSALAERILDEANVAVVAGDAFGEDRSIRLSYATSDALLGKALERLRKFFLESPGRKGRAP
jgi:aspartate aminotransferase